MTELVRMEGGANYSRPMADTVIAQFGDRITRITGFRPGSMANGHPDFHSQGKAIDIYASQSDMTAIAKWIFHSFPGSTELIHWNPNPADNTETQLMNKLSNTGYHNYAADGLAHMDHVHWAVSDLSQIGNPAPASGSTSTPATGATGATGIAGFFAQLANPAFMEKLSFIVLGSVLVVGSVLVMAGHKRTVSTLVKKATVPLS